MPSPCRRSACCSFCGTSRSPSKRLSRDLEVLRFHVAFDERQPFRGGALLLEKGGIEPFALLRWIDDRQVVLTRGECPELKRAVLIRSRRHDLTRLRVPEGLILREGQD